MRTAEAIETRDVIDPIAAAARAGDEAAFAELAGPLRDQLEAHCQRMLGSIEEAEDVVQETFLRAWRSRASYRGDASFRAWLYRIATNACHDAVQRRMRHPQPVEGPDGEAPEEMGATDPEPEAAVLSKEATELVLGAAIEHLTARQRAVLALRCVLDLPAGDTASLLEASVPSVNSALQRARAILRHRLPEQGLERARRPCATGEKRALPALARNA